MQTNVIKQLTKWGPGAALFIFLLVGLVAPAHALLTLQFESGLDVVNVTDGGANDLLPAAPGQILFSGSVGVFDLNVTTGITDSGSATPNLIMDLNSVNQSTGPGVLTITFTDTGLTFPTGEVTFNSAIGGTTSKSSLAYSLLVNGVPSLSLSGGPLSNLFAEAKSGTTTVGSPYTMSLQTIITATDASTTSYDWKVEVPEPSAMFLVGVGLLGLALWGRRQIKRSNK